MDFHDESLVKILIRKIIFSPKKHRKVGNLTCAIKSNLSKGHTSSKLIIPSCTCSKQLDYSKKLQEKKAHEILSGLLYD